MFGAGKAARRFTLLLLEEGEDYVADWVATCQWPAQVTGNWQKAEQLAGRLRLCSKSLFFDADDARAPIIRLPFAQVQQLQPEGMKALTVTTTKLTKMKANTVDAPYIVEKGSPTVWRFTLTYSTIDSLMPLVHEQLAISRLPYGERAAALQAASLARTAAAAFDTSRLADFGERIYFDGVAHQLMPLVRIPGRLVVTGARVYFQPLHNVAGDAPVLSHPLRAVAAVARRRSSLRPLGVELFFLESAEGRGPFWGAPSAFFALPTPADAEKVVQVLLQQEELGAALPGGSAAAEATGSILELWAMRMGSATLKSALEAGIRTAAHLRPGRLSSPRLSTRATGWLGQRFNPAAPVTAAGEADRVSTLVALQAESGWLAKVTGAWQAAKISNLDYLLYCNLAAGRSFNDLTQWPVMPWVLADYSSPRLNMDDPATFRDLSRPIGALNAQRLAMYKQRYADMPREEGADPPFLYGTHYSCPGYVMYWLVRAAPAHLLRLQNGRFDAPDRMFLSMGDSWDSVTRNPADVKELIPEFFLGDGSFLVNLEKLPLGLRQNGKSVDSVELPAWAASPQDFIAKHRAALESPYVSANLHHWLDLIFGFKQRGEAAEQADNVFHPLTYEGAVNVDGLVSAQERAALESQINEFGQCPRQLFARPHPPRLACPAVAEWAAAMPVSGEGAALSLALLSTIMAAATAHSGGLDAAREGQLQQLDVLPRQLSHPRSPTRGAQQEPGTLFSASSTEGAAQRQQEPLEGSRSSTERMGKLRGWSGRLGEQFTSVLDTLSKGDPDTRSSPSGVVSPSGGSRASLASLRNLFARPVPEQALSGPLNKAGSASGHDAEQAGVPAAKEGQSCEPPAAGLRVPSSAAAQQGPSLSRHQSGAAGVASGAQPPADGSQGQLSRQAQAGPVRQGPQAQGAPSRQMSHAGPPDAAAGTQRQPPSRHTSAARLQVPAEASGQTGQSEPQAELPPSAAPGGRVPLAPAPAAGDSSGATGLGCSGFEGAPWGPDLRSRVPAAARSVSGQQGPVSAVLAASMGGVPTAFCVGHGASLRMFDLCSQARVRSLQLGEVPLTSLTAIVAADAEQGHTPAVLLAGSYDSHVYAYAPGPGRQLGAFAGHSDAVSCLHLWAPDQLLTASWDCSVKLWSLAEGRQPWTRDPPHFPAAALAEADAGLWALTAGSPDCPGPAASCVLAGSEEGCVLTWDARSSHAAWKASLCQDYISGLAVTPDGQYVLASSADSHLRLLDLRRPGAVLAEAACSAALQCCAANDEVAVAGADDGQVHFWDLNKQMGRTPSGAQRPSDAAGMWAPWSSGRASPVNCVCLRWLAGPSEASPQLYFLAGLEDGTLLSTVVMDDPVGQ